MNVGKTLFAHVMEFATWKTIGRIIARHKGDAGVRTLDCADLFRVMAFAQLTWRESPFRSTKAAIKLHTLLDLRGAIPTFIRISDGKLHDVNVLDILPVEPGSFYVMDRGYLDYAQLYTMHQAGAFFLTRAKRGMDGRCVHSSPTQRDSGMICDQPVMLNGCYAAKAYPEHLRRVRFKDPESDKTLVFLTNNTALPALTIAALYKSRWQVELSFDVAPWCTSSHAMQLQWLRRPRSCAAWRIGHCTGPLVRMTASRE